MKKFLSLITLTLMVIITYFALSVNAAPLREDFLAAANMLPFSNTAELFLQDGNSIKTDTVRMQNMLKNPEILAEISGFLVRFSGSEQGINGFLRQFSASHVYFQRLGAITIAYAYAPQIGGAAEHNLQIAHRNGVITVGVPLIQGSF